MRKIITSALILALLCSCSSFSSLIHDDQVVAKVGKHKLHKSELEQIIPEMSTPQDSAIIASRYINSWAMDLLYINVAESQLSKAEMDVSVDLETYRRSLIKYRYEQRYINDRLDTLVSESEIKQYHQEHKDEFILARPILKVRFVDVMKDSPNKEAILQMMNSGEYDDVQRADTLAKSTALNYFDNSDTWMDASDLAKAFGVEYGVMLSNMKDNVIKIEPEGRGDLLVAFVLDIQRDGVAPVAFCEARIRDIIISKRKHQIVKGLEQDLLENALENKLFVIYQNEQNN